MAVTKLHLENLGYSPTWCWSNDAGRASRQKVIDYALAENAMLVIGHEPRLRLQKFGTVQTVQSR